VQREDGVEFSRVATIREAFPGARCNECEWKGPRDQLKDSGGVMDEFCPECGSDDTEWLTPEELSE
jgi:predicted RNA-binding Zn-ribbon protein involved in translation (DUF1610 family)